MAEPALNAPFFATVDAFLVWAAEREGRFEFVEGAVRATAPPSDRHDALAANLFAALLDRLRGGPCRPLGPGAAVTPDRTRANARQPDLRVFCRNPGTLGTLTAVVEVLSPGTEREDRGAKLREYEATPGLLHYVLLDQDEPRAETYTRPDAPEDGWAHRVAAGDGAALRLPLIGVAVPLDALYADLPPSADDSTG